MIIAFRLENLQCDKICRKIQKLLETQKPDPEKHILVVRLSEIHNEDVLKITQEELLLDQEQH